MVWDTSKIKLVVEKLSSHFLELVPGTQQMREEWISGQVSIYFFKLSAFREFFINRFLQSKSLPLKSMGRQRAQDI